MALRFLWLVVLSESEAALTEGCMSQKVGMCDLSVPRQHRSDAAAPLFPCLHQEQLKGPEGVRSWRSSLPVPPSVDVTQHRMQGLHIPTPWGPRVPCSDLSSLILGLLGPWDPPKLLSSPTGAALASVYPHFCPSQHSRVCLLMAPSAEQTERGDRRAAGRELPVLPPAWALQ